MGKWEEKRAAKRQAIRVLLKAGRSVREVMAALHCSPRVVIKERDDLLIAKERFEPCPCGRRAGHKGLCSHRMSKQPEGWKRRGSDWGKRSDGRWAGR